MLKVRFMLDNISIILISSSKFNNNWIEWLITLWLMPMIHWEWREVRWLFPVTWPGQSRQLDGIEAAEAVPLRPPSMPLWSRDNRCWTRTRSSSQVELDPKSSLPPLVGHAEPVVPYLISAYWTQYLDHVIIQSTEEDMDRRKFANIPLKLPISFGHGPCSGKRKCQVGD